MNLPEWVRYLQDLNGHDLLIVAKTLEGVLDFFQSVPTRLSSLRTLVDAFFEEAAAKETEEEARRREMQGDQRMKITVEKKATFENEQEGVNFLFYIKNRYLNHDGVINYSSHFDGMTCFGQTANIVVEWTEEIEFDDSIFNEVVLRGNKNEC